MGPARSVNTCLGVNQPRSKRLGVLYGSPQEIGLLACIKLHAMHFSVVIAHTFQVAQPGKTLLDSLTHPALSSTGLHAQPHCSDLLKEYWKKPRFAAGSCSTRIKDSYR
jgi:hypothetical protein